MSGTKSLALIAGFASADLLDFTTRAGFFVAVAVLSVLGSAMGVRCVAFQTRTRKRTKFRGTSAWKLLVNRPIARRALLAVGSLAPFIASGPLSLTNFPATGAARFFRLAIDDVDSDGDGVPDYDELALGFNPATQRTDRNDQTDLARITNGLSAASAVTISALDPLLFERWPDPGLVAVRRSGGLLPLTVNFALGGTATPDVDYVSSATNSMLIPAGVREVWLEFYPVTDADDAESTETITVTLPSGQGYSIGASNAANLTLANETASSLPNVKSAARFLIQAAYGPDLAPANGTPPNLAEVTSVGFEGWIEGQFTRPVNYLQPWVDWAAVNGDALQLYGNWKEFSWWARAMGAPKLRPDSVTNTIPDPLRQRVAFALSEILVVSDRPENSFQLP